MSQEIKKQGDIRTGFSLDMYDQTERPGVSFPVQTHKIITHRYQYAGDLAKGKRTLDVGCGAGMGLAYLKEQTDFLVAGDYSAENINLIHSHGNDLCPLLRLDAHKLPLADNSFDAVVAMAMIYYLQMEDFLSEIKRILTPEGLLFFDSSNKDMPGFWPSPHITRYYSVPELAVILRKAGFDACFHGVFPAEKSLEKRRIRAMVKNAVKKPLLMLPGGAKLWRRLRRYKTQPEGIPLPAQIGALDCSDVVVYPIPSDRIDRDHTVIYVTAKPLKNH